MVEELFHDRREADERLQRHAVAAACAFHGGRRDGAYCAGDVRGKFAEKDGAIAAYRLRAEQVRSAIPPERLLVFDVADGWEPLCRFLGHKVPNTPFPNMNSNEDFWKLVRGEAR